MWPLSNSGREPRPRTLEEQPNRVREHALPRCEDTRLVNRPTLVERTAYEPKLPVEEFMVPLLKGKIEGILEGLPICDTEYKVLDLGCGGQPFRHLFEKRGHKYVSADAQDPLGIVDCIVEVDKELPEALLSTGPFDFILCTEVMEHVADWDQAFTNFGRLLKTRGRILITCPHFYILHEEPYDFWRPTIYALRFYSMKHNLGEIVLEPLGDSWDVLGTVLGAGYDSLKPRRQDEFLNRISARFWNCMFKASYKALAKRWLQKRYVLSNELYPVYLSNVALFEKQ